MVGPLLRSLPLHPHIESQSIVHTVAQRSQRSFMASLKHLRRQNRCYGDGLVFTWGSDKDTGALGHDAKDRDGDCPLPVPVEGLSNCVFVAAGPNISAAVTSPGDLYVWGKGLGLGCGGDVTTSVPRPTQVILPSSAAGVQTVSFGSTHAMCLCENGQVFVWGGNRRGQLGLGVSSVGIERRTPHLLDSIPGPVVDAKCCENYSAAVNALGHLYTWGCSKSLGHGGSFREAALEPSPRRILGALLEESVVSIGLGSLYMGCCTESGRCFTWGYGGHGNLGHGSRRSESEPVVVSGLDYSHQRAVHISCTVGQPTPGGGLNPKQDGQEGPHTLLVVHEIPTRGFEKPSYSQAAVSIGNHSATAEGPTAASSLYTFGTCHKGLCGNLASKTLTAPYDELQPYQVGSALRDVKTLKSKVTGAGGGEAKDYEAMLPDTESRWPRRELLGNVVGVASASIHNLCWNSDGELWAFGCGSGGRCGVGYFVIGANPSKPRKSRMKAYMSAPNRVGAPWPPTPEQAAALNILELDPALENAFVRQAAASRYHGICLADLPIRAPP